MDRPENHPYKPGEEPELPRLEWIWWVFSLYYFVPVFYTPFNWANYLLVFSAYAAFVALCAICISVDRTRVWLPISALLLLGVITGFLTPGAGNFFTYAGFFIGFSFKARWRHRRNTLSFRGNRKKLFIRSYR